MGNRYGRNKRRQAREEIAKLEATVQAERDHSSLLSYSNHRLRGEMAAGGRLPQELEDIALRQLVREIAQQIGPDVENLVRRLLTTSHAKPLQVSRHALPSQTVVGVRMAVNIQAEHAIEVDVF